MVGGVVGPDENDDDATDDRSKCLCKNKAAAVERAAFRRSEHIVVERLPD